jgi:hypothetical protein
MILLKKNNYYFNNFEKKFKNEKNKYKFLGLSLNKKNFFLNLKDRKFRIFDKFKKKIFFLNLSKILNFLSFKFKKKFFLKKILNIFSIYIFIKKVKNNLFLNFSSNLNHKIIYKTSLKSIEKLKNKNEIYNNFNLVYLFFFKSLNNFFKKIICIDFFFFFKNNFSYFFFFEIIFNFLENKIQKKIKNYFNFFIKLYFNKDFKNIKLLFLLKKVLKKLKHKTKIKIIFFEIIYKKAFNGCKLKKNRRL